MANKTLFELTEGNAPALTDYALTGEDPTNTHVLRRTTWQSLRNLFLSTQSGEKKTLRGSISNPQAMYAQAPQIVLIDATENAITITGVYIKLNDTTPGAELAGDLKFADDQVDGSFANATLICAGDTTSGVFSKTSSFDDATIPVGKAVYFQMDASPHADIKRFTIKVTYTVD